MSKVEYSDVKQFEPMIEFFLKKHVVRNWNNASLSKEQGDVFLGSTGMTMNDIRSFLTLEIVSVLSKYDPSRKASKCTLVYTHLNNRTISLVKKLCLTKYGYGKVHYDLDSLMGNGDPDWA
jgi:hypothetical protein